MLYVELSYTPCMTFTIYALFDEREPEVVRYIGFSRRPSDRLQEHLQEARYSQKYSHRLHWLRKVISDNARVEWRSLVVVETAEEAAIAEIAAIKDHREAGHPLCNGTDGGEGIQGFGGVLSPDALARKAATISTPEWSAQRSELSSRYWSSEETRDQHRKAMEAYWLTQEGLALREKCSTLAKAQLADPNYTGGPRTESAREKMRDAKLGKPHARQRTAEWNAKISAAQKGIKRGEWSEERKAAHRARLNDPATKAKMSESAKARKRGAT